MEYGAEIRLSEEDLEILRRGRLPILVEVDHSLGQLGLDDAQVLVRAGDVLLGGADGILDLGQARLSRIVLRGQLVELGLQLAEAGLGDLQLRLLVGKSGGRSLREKGHD